ncbi:hypothetical protein ACQ4LE_008403 [Meloidogyne hapla]
MKSSLSAVMLTTVFFLCSAVFFIKVCPQGLSDVATSPASNGTTSNGSQSTTDDLKQQEEPKVKASSNGPDPMFNAMFPPKGDGPQELLVKKIEAYNEKVKHVQAQSLINDVITTKESESKGSSSTAKAESTGKVYSSSGAPTVIVGPSGTPAALKQPRSLTLRWTFLSVSGGLLFMICALLCYEQCCQSPHY